jgi:hypothetical protein
MNLHGTSLEPAGSIKDVWKASVKRSDSSQTTSTEQHGAAPNSTSFC